MIVLVDERDIVKEGYAAGFKKEGVSTIGLDPDDFMGWVTTVPSEELEAVDAFLLGTFEHRQQFQFVPIDDHRASLHLADR